MALLTAPFENQMRLAAPSLPGAAGAALSQAFHTDPLFDGCVLAVTSGPASLDRFIGDAEAFRSESCHLRVFPMLSGNRDDEAAAARLSILRVLSEKKPVPMLLATCVQALMQPSPDPHKTERLSRALKVGPDEGPEALAAWLEENGFRRAPEVYERGTYTVKGGIVDVWPASAGVPSRVEYFGDDIESLRTFHPDTQRSDQPLESLLIPPMRLPPKTSCLLHRFLPEQTIVLWLDWENTPPEASLFAETSGCPQAHRLPAIETELNRRKAVRQYFFGGQAPEHTPPCELPIRPVEGFAGKEIFADASPEILEVRRRNLMEGILSRPENEGAKVIFCMDSDGMAAHLRNELPEGLKAEVLNAPLSGGFQIADAAGKEKRFLYSQFDLFGYRKQLQSGFDATMRLLRDGAADQSRIRRGRLAVPVVPDDDNNADELLADDPAETLAARIFEHFAPGDLVVHLEHGIGCYRGTKTIEFAGGRREVIVLEYANNARLLVPLTQANLLSRYSGVNDIPVKLHSLSGRRWNTEKLAAQQSVQRLAFEMLSRQARRKTMPGHAFDAFTPYLEEFEASFPFRETPGQLDCLRHVYADLQSPHPMDRLICGDAGYGKTEIALRAAFVAAMQGKQVAVLVPTTILAQQHYENFRSRLAPYPIVVGLHSRFTSPGERAELLKKAASGAVDIIIGTHGILGENVTFRDLGLVIVDEEQRFGVLAKERLKTVCEQVDVLTLSATPIPRTLYLGITGARDLSLLRTPPPGRVAVETIVAQDDDQTVSNAVLREIERGGQVFFLHNRVMTLDLVYARLHKLFPHLRIATAHGQMSSREIGRIMRDFSNGHYDILLSTTIVENGIDVPRANTILVDRADWFGISDLYQLRGRVGRSSVQAYAYFLTPPLETLSSDAKERLEALEAASRLGSGVTLALRDLSIRGAGNLLGAEQSGHISAIGFTLYCQLLRRAIAQLKGVKPPLLINVEADFPFLSLSPTSPDAELDDPAGAYLPHAYMDSDSQRILFHRRLAECASEQELNALHDEIDDRFGTAPQPLLRLYKTTLAAILCAERGISRIHFRDGDLFLYREGLPLRFRGRLPHPVGNTPDELLDATIRLIRAQEILPGQTNRINLSGVSPKRRLSSQPGTPAT